MTFNGRRIVRIAAAFASVAILATATTTNAQSHYPPTPPQGPPPNLSDGSPYFGIDTLFTRHCCNTETGLPDGLYDQIEQAVAANNSAYVDNYINSPATPGALVQATKTRYSPWMYATQYTDRPNQHIALISYFVKYDITNLRAYGINYPFARTASQSIELRLSCAGWYPWYQGRGQLTLTSVVSDVNLDTGHSVLEDTFGGILWNNVIPQFVDRQISSALGRFPRGTRQASLGIPCNTLGVQANPGNPGFDAVMYDYVPPKIVVTGLKQLSVSVTQVRRLKARDLETNTPLYYPVEQPRLELFVGYHRLTIDLPEMQENDVYVPGPTVVSTPIPPTDPAYSGQLVIIANMRVPFSAAGHLLDNVDSAVVVSDKNTKFGVGTRTISTPKLSSSSSFSSKGSILVGTPGYEVTLKIAGPATIAH